MDPRQEFWKTHKGAECKETIKIISESILCNQK